MAMNEYEAKIKSNAEFIRTLRANSGASTSTLTFALMAVLLSKNKISEKDLDLIFEVEKGSTATTLKSYFESNFGDPTFDLKNEKEMEDVLKVCMDEVEKQRSYIAEVAKKIENPLKTKRHAEKAERDEEEEGVERRSVPPISKRKKT